MQCKIDRQEQKKSVLAKVDFIFFNVTLQNEIQ